MPGTTVSSRSGRGGRQRDGGGRSGGERRRLKRLRSDMDDNEDATVMVISSDDDEQAGGGGAAQAKHRMPPSADAARSHRVDDARPSAWGTAAVCTVVGEDEQRLLDPDQELNDNIVNRYLQHVVDGHQDALHKARTHPQGDAQVPWSVLVAVSSHFLPRWRSLWREMEDLSKGTAATSGASSDGGLAQRMRGWIGGRGAPQGSSGQTTAADAPHLCLRHWVALYDLPMRHVYAPKQHTIDTRHLLERHLEVEGGCAHCMQRACILFPVHVPKQNHWILVALHVPAASSARRSLLMPLCKVHVYDSMLWLHHRYSRYYPFDDDDDDLMVAAMRGSGRAESASGRPEWLHNTDDDVEMFVDACDGRAYRRLLLRKTLRPLLAAVQLIAMHRVLSFGPNHNNGSEPTAAATTAFPRTFRWRVRWHRYTVTQQNAVDCGVAVCKAAGQIGQSLCTASASAYRSRHLSRSERRLERRRVLSIRKRGGAVGSGGVDGQGAAEHRWTAQDVLRYRLECHALQLQHNYWRLLERSNLKEYRQVMYRALYPPPQWTEESIAAAASPPVAAPQAQSGRRSTRRPTSSY